MIRKVCTVREREAGFSMVEGLIATAVLLLVVLGLLPLFTQSMLNNVAGREAIITTNFAGDEIETVSQLEVTNASLNFATGNALQTLEMFEPDGTLVERIITEVTEVGRLTDAQYRELVADAGWSETPTDLQWARVITVRHFPATAIETGELGIDDQLTASVGALNRDLMEIEVTMLQGHAGNDTIVAAAPVTTYRYYKYF